ncbi:hypothetical protein H4R18_000142 [Coemansia javaensis]|uniref:Peptidase S26 domain-containing protein n=1 Tax=Coemansia javaensis TaxID=2761396 RepID=A0A9W8LML4_9FUNG|nr:hypothetical protein H4R18_000142 [Coemansia javaensis]
MGFFARSARAAWQASQTAVFVAVPTACFVHTVFDYAGEIAPSMGPSMLPTIGMMGDLLLIERLPGWRRRLRVGDLVVYHSPADPGRRAIKRVLGAAGDVLCVDPTRDRLAYVQIPRGHVWLQGDNYSNSTDSRAYGPIPLALVRGRVLACVWPSPRWLPNNVEIIPGYFGAD